MTTITKEPSKKKTSKTYSDVLTTGLRIKKSDVVKRVFSGGKSGYSQQQVINELQKMKDKYKDKNLIFMVSIFIPDVGDFRSAKSFHVNSKSNITPTNYDWERTPEFLVYVWKAR